MKTFPEIFKKYTTQLWYIFLTPAMFFVIMGVYRPFGNPEALDMGRSLFVFNVTIMMCIMMVSDWRAFLFCVGLYRVV